MRKLCELDPPFPVPGRAGTPDPRPVPDRAQGRAVLPALLRAYGQAAAPVRRKFKSTKKNSPKFKL